MKLIRWLAVDALIFFVLFLLHNSWHDLCVKLNQFSNNIWLKKLKKVKFNMCAAWRKSLFHICTRKNLQSTSTFNQILKIAHYKTWAFSVEPTSYNPPANTHPRDIKIIASEKVQYTKDRFYHTLITNVLCVCKEYIKKTKCYTRYLTAWRIYMKLHNTT